MDAHEFGAFVAECRKNKKMTQADLAAKIQVTDKAVSRWERGIGFPDINTLEPLANALEISVLELMKSERMVTDKVTNEEFILGITVLSLIVVLFLDNMQWQADTILFFIVGVFSPLLCIGGFVALIGTGIWRKATGKPCRQTFIIALILLLLLAVIFGLFALAGALGIGPVPN